MILIFLTGFKYARKWRLPIAVYASGILFGLSHAGNVGWNGETFSATIAQGNWCHGQWLSLGCALSLHRKIMLADALSFLNGLFS